MEYPIDITDLLYKHIREELSAQEAIQLQHWVNERAENQTFFNKATDIKLLLHNASTKTENLQEIDLDQAWADLKKMGWGGAEEPSAKVKAIDWRRAIAAAAAILVLVIAAWMLLPRKVQRTPAEKPAVAKVNDVQPGKFKAMLTLSDGRTVALDTAMQGELAKQGDVTVLNRNGNLVYDLSKQTPSSLANSFNTLSTANGQTYAMTLSDGSKVWLNSGSSIKYPVVFAAKERRVEITGEAYFEVTHDAKKPFYVVLNGMEIQVLGTHFNVNNYANEVATKTTLLEGKVRVHAAATNEQTILEPGEQAQFTKKSQALNKAKNIDVDAVIAWRFGYFQFNNADLKAVMHQLERWYNVEVIYQGDVRNDLELIGKIPRSMNLSQVLNVLQTQQLHYKLEGHKIIVLP